MRKEYRPTGRGAQPRASLTAGQAPAYVKGLCKRTWRNWQTHQIQVASHDIEDSRDTEKTSPIGEPTRPDKAPVSDLVGQSWGNPERLTELETAIANVTRLLGKTDDAGVAAELVAERRAMRLEVEGLRREAAGVIDLATERRKR
jgi:hypothetical protein